jgi:hypothetical protein
VTPPREDPSQVLSGGLLEFGIPICAGACHGSLLRGIRDQPHADKVLQVVPDVPFGGVRPDNGQAGTAEVGMSGWMSAVSRPLTLAALTTGCAGRSAGARGPAAADGPQMVSQRKEATSPLPATWPLTCIAASG